MVSALLVAASGFEEIEMISPVDLLRRMGAAVTLASIMPKEEGLLVKGQNGISIQFDAVRKRKNNL